MPVKSKQHENLSDNNIAKVIELLEAEQPITKKAACEILNISYNTPRLDKIIQEYKDKVAYTKKRRTENRGKPLADWEISELVEYRLQGYTVTEISKFLYRTSQSINDALVALGVPFRGNNPEERSKTLLLPKQCESDEFSPGQIVFSAVHHSLARVEAELTEEYQTKRKGFEFKDYEKDYGCKCYAIYILEETDSSDSFFPFVEKGGYSAYALAYDLGSLEHLKKYSKSLLK